jgi:hypothetical protein
VRVRIREPELEVTTMKTIIIGLIFAGVFAAAGCSQTSTQSASAGPNGGDLVPIKGGNAYAELLANADTGEVLVNTWDKDLKTRRPIENEPITVGSDDKSVELSPHPMDTDPSGTCSRFYGEASWAHGGGVRRGWMHGGGTGNHHDFEWSRCWQAGQTHGRMWEDMGEHRHMGPGYGPGGPGHGPGGPGHGPGHQGGPGE